MCTYVHVAIQERIIYLYTLEQYNLAPGPLEKKKNGSVHVISVDTASQTRLAALSMLGQDIIFHWITGPDPIMSHFHV